MKTVGVKDTIDILSIFKKILVDKDDEYDDVTIDLKHFDDSCMYDAKILSKFKELQKRTAAKIRFVNINGNYRNFKQAGQ